MTACHSPSFLVCARQYAGRFGVGSTASALTSRTCKEVEMAEKSICTVAGCCNPARTRKLCRSHYYRLMEHGDPLAGRTPEGAPRRFFDAALLSDTDECIIWPFSRAPNGYGHFTMDGVVGSTHRAMCRKAHGEPPTPHHQARHSCAQGKQGCINPRHLAWGTAQDNADDVLAHGHRPMGESSHSAKLTESQVREIRAIATGSGDTALGRRYGVKPSTIYMIRKRKNWRHLE